jgi:hypothetical protein
VEDLPQARLFDEQKAEAESTAGPTLLERPTLRPQPKVRCRRHRRRLAGQRRSVVSVTGVFDDTTTRGVAQYQRNRSITGDPPGVFGPVTRASAQAAERSAEYRE